MKIKKLILNTNKLEEEKHFYSSTLGFDVHDESQDSFTLKIGWSELTFSRSESQHLYHYCFLVPCNQLNEAMDWMEKRVDIIPIENDRKIQRFESWNAESFYFYDASGNIAEFIVRHDLKNESEESFNLSNVLCVNEIGMPTQNVDKTNTELMGLLNTEFWKGDLERFGTNGSQEGIFLIPNYTIKEAWFPTNQKITSEPFEIQVENHGVYYDLCFQNENMEIKK